MMLAADHEGNVTQTATARKTNKSKATTAAVGAQRHTPRGARFTAKPPTLDQLKANAEALVPTFAARAAATENARQLPGETMDDLYKAGLLRVVAPKRYGGLEMDWPALPE